MTTAATAESPWFADLLADYGHNVVEARQSFHDKEAVEAYASFAKLREAGERLCSTPNAQLKLRFEEQLVRSHLKLQAAVTRLEAMAVSMEALMDNAAIGQVHAQEQTAPYRAHEPAEPGVAPALLIGNPALGHDVEPHVPRPIVALRHDGMTIGPFMT